MLVVFDIIIRNVLSRFGTMAWTSYQKFLAIMMVVTGSINTLSTKWADNIYSVGTDGQSRKFEHPFLQVNGHHSFVSFLFCLK